MFIIAIVISFAITAVAGIFIIPFLIKIKSSQTEREDGPESHLKKTGTPTMGGIMFLLGFFIVAGVGAFKANNIIPILIATALFGAIGFIDDYIKVVMKRSLGLTPAQKMLLMFVATAVLVWYIHTFTSVSFDMAIPFSAFFTPDGQDIYFNFGIFTIPLIFVAVIGTVNGSNFTDGVDGLLSSVTVVIALFIAAASFKLGTNISVSSGAMIGGLLGFLIYNHHPAKVFMGDTGSLAIGGFVASSLLMMRLSIVTVLVAFVYLAEVISVIIQVGYFKATKGKRFFRMAPIHHHFELGGWSEVKVVRNFTIFTFVLCLIALAVI
ncbi:MAG: phospho-N-acetylmuramoyl-pentapeptide-transferase [Lachnospiraceae bacterium]|nr:phospho-N-acetylmuramoyl-pentapeptide-transferase [Lachnospiraceae bacterium]